MINNLTSVGKSHPQQAWIVLSRSTKFKSTYLFRTTPSVNKYAMEYKISLTNFISAMIGRQLDEKINEQACLPIGKGGLGITINADEYGDQQYTDSKILTYHLSKYILEDETFSHDKHKEVHNTIMKSKKSYWD